MAAPGNLSGENWHTQGDGDLGQRLARATERHMASAGAVLLIGTDCPTLSASQLQAAACHPCVTSTSRPIWPVCRRGGARVKQASMGSKVRYQGKTRLKRF